MATFAMSEDGLCRRQVIKMELGLLDEASPEAQLSLESPFKSQQMSSFLVDPN